MKRTIGVTLSAWTVAMGLGATVCAAAAPDSERAVTAGPADTSDTPVAAVSEVAQAGAGLAEVAEQQFIAALTQSPQAMATLLADDFIYLTTAGSAIGKQTLLEHLRSGRTVVLEARRTPSRLIERADTVVSSGVLQLKVRQDGAEQTIRSRYLHVWSRSGPSGLWQLLARQAAVLPEGVR